MPNLPSEAWYLLIAGLVIVLVLAIWMGRGIRITKRSISVEAAREAPRTGINVARGAHIEGSDVGDITGVSLTGKGSVPATKTPVDVLGGAVVKDARLGDVAGVRQDEGKPGPR